MLPNPPKMGPKTIKKRCKATVRRKHKKKHDKYHKPRCPCGRSHMRSDHACAVQTLFSSSRFPPKNLKNKHQKASQKPPKNIRNPPQNNAKKREMETGPRKGSPNSCFFSPFLPKTSQNGDQNGGEIAPFIGSVSQRGAFGHPGPPKGARGDPKSPKL